MTKLEVIKSNKTLYKFVSDAMEDASPFEKAVTQNLILPWIKGRNWEGGLSDSAFQKGYEKCISLGYDSEEIINEFQRQVTVITGL